MSLELSIQNLADAINKAVALMNGTHPLATKLTAAPPPATVPNVPAPTPPAPVMVQPAVAPPAPVTASPSNVMPPPPVFAAPVVNPAPTGVAPFNDPKGLIEYVMAAYKAMGAAKGAGIQGVLGTLGYQNINDVAPAHYSALFAGIEGLK